MHSLTDIRSAFLGYFQGKDHTVVPSAPLVPHNDPTLMFTNAGMVPFKDVFSGRETRPYVRATSSQKCVRAGGKHNDLDNVGYTTRHHTFFEMLGNFSFGNYFKEGAIEYAWEFLTKTLGLQPEKLSITVYHTDDEAFAIWKKLTGFADEKILRVPTKDNFWSMGDTGPCGPCSEIFYDHGALHEGKWKLDSHGHDLFGSRYVEIWNLVFMQFEALPDGRQINLPRPSIDTGSGLERVAAVLQGTHDNYEVDLFEELIGAIEELSGVGCRVSGKEQTETRNPKPETASFRVIADHIRSCSFLIADGVLPSNEGRGYVLRRIMRRAMRHAHLLGCKEPLMYKLFPTLKGLMGAHYPELGRAEALITETLRHEEERFKDTLDKGLKLLDEELSSIAAGKPLSGQVAFKLYDTYGFPLDLTQDILRGRQLEVDMPGFESAMQEQKARARAAWKGSGAAGTDDVWYGIKEAYGPTEFLGYEQESGSGKVLAMVKDGTEIETALSGEEVAIITNQTPFYGESGGQMGDKGVLSTDTASIQITDTKKYLGDLIVHLGIVQKGSLNVGDTVQMQVDADRRSRLRANHSATHLLHAALRNLLGAHISQKGSQVESENFRFDFSHPKKVSEEELARIEAEVNRIIAQGDDVTTRLMTPDEAIAEGAVALFGEKYGEEVRVLTMGKGEGAAFSVELCGGTHVRNTGEIEQFKIISESSVASGIRRIEGVTKDRVSSFMKAQEQRQLEEEKRRKEAEVKAKEQAASASEIRGRFAAMISEAETLGDVVFLGKALEGVPGKELRGLIDDFKAKTTQGVAVLIATESGKASIAVGVSESLTSRFNAVELVKIGAEILGGNGGGGRPDMAQAGGTQPEKAEEAIAAIRAKVQTI